MGSDGIDKSKFTEYIIAKNPITLRAFKEWVFYPGMLFNSLDKWWGSGKRDKPHEGLDLCFYADQHDKIFRIKEKTLIPAMYDGIVAGIIDDYLGKSIIIEHALNGQAGSFCTIFGHVIPKAGIAIGSNIEQGEAVAEITLIGKSKAKILPHLHISLGRVSEGLSYGELDWGIISDPKRFSLYDPVQLIDSGYRVIEQDVLKNRTELFK